MRNRSLWRPLVALSCFLSLVSCGNSSSPDSNAPPPQFAAAVTASGITVAASTFVNRTSAGPNSVEETWKVSLKNNGLAQTNVTIKLVSAGEGVTITNGTIRVANVPANATVPVVPDPVVLRHAPGVTVNPASFVWTVEIGLPSGKVDLDRTATIAGTDADGDGIRDDIDKMLRLIGTVDQQPALRQVARAAQRSLLIDPTPEQALAAAVAMDKALGCLATKSADYGDQVKVISSATLNTEARFMANIQFMSLLKDVDVSTMAPAECVN